MTRPGQHRPLQPRKRTVALLLAALTLMIGTLGSYGQASMLGNGSYGHHGSHGHHHADCDSHLAPTHDASFHAQCQALCQLACSFATAVPAHAPDASLAARIEDTPDTLPSRRAFHRAQLLPDARAPPAPSNTHA
ncbi:hypothetical protein SAMN05192555_10762 [Franzmannia pantelleriensis]|uniref:DUF2946 domain-containing protein n=1 Tax=Franzmannia pantelleriensis TaxID=48727 RepID=A0A1G9N7J9_9GAMM|nr:hypothetical protein [Halomonas pantelleriensis]SDL82374.1 hypothetical protein SAMN05192555_10762 [Halomonas pantelleriensis]